MGAGVTMTRGILCAPIMGHVTTSSNSRVEGWNEAKECGLMWQRGAISSHPVKLSHFGFLSMCGIGCFPVAPAGNRRVTNPLYTRLAESYTLTNLWDRDHRREALIDPPKHQHPLPRPDHRGPDPITSRLSHWACSDHATAIRRWRRKVG